MKFEQKGTIKGTEMLTFNQLQPKELFLALNFAHEVHIKSTDCMSVSLVDGQHQEFLSNHPVIRVTGTLTYKKDPNQDPKGECDA